jgi:prepilin signal peptidase PulO-like enzyme (type II secretory pathway)
MSWPVVFILFVFGLGAGSFLNVVSLRYKANEFIFSPSVIGGRSRCPTCKHTLSPYDLIPLVSFICLKRRCRYCGSKISFQYPFVEILSGLIFVFVPARLSAYYLLSTTYYLLSLLWIFVFLLLLLMSLIDLRLSVIPDEINVLLLLLGILVLVFLPPNSPPILGEISTIFGFYADRWLNSIFAAFVGAAFFGFLILATRGRGMGVGDLKLIVPLGILFGWPAIVFVAAAAFIIGAAVGIYLIIFKKETPKSAVPFGPFLALSSAIVFFFGSEIVDFYLKSFRLF